MVIVPPGGFAGFAQMTSSSKNILSRAVKRGGSTKRSKSKGPKRRRGVAKRRNVYKKREKRGKRARLVKGSAAAKAYMAKIRRKRKRG